MLTATSKRFTTPLCSAFLLLVALVLTLPISAIAATRCIDSVGQVTFIMDAAMASADTFEDVRFKEGAFNFSSGAFGYFGVLQGTGKTLQISGGWAGSPGVCTSRSNNIGATQLWGFNERKVLAINASTTFTGSIIIENLLIGGGFSSTNTSGTCLALGEQNGGVMGIRLDRVWISNCTTPANGGVDAPAVSLVSSSSLVVRNNIIVDNNPGVGVTVASALKGGAGFIINNTIVDNASANVNGFVGISSSASNMASITMANNVFDRNIATAAGRVDIRLGTGVSLQNNRFTGLFGVPVSNTGSSTGAAGFANGSYELALASSARDAGAFFAPAIQGTLDIAGQPRVFGSAVDLGAFEFAFVFADGFESP